MLGRRQTWRQSRQREAGAASPVTRTQGTSAPHAGRAKTQARVSRSQRAVPPEVTLLPDGALRADRGPPATAVTPGRGAPSPADALGGAGPGAHRAPRRPLLPPSPVEPLPDARGTFGPRSFLLPDFHFSYLVLSHILCAANGSHFRRPGPSTSSAAAPRLGGLQARSSGGRFQIAQPARWGNQHVGSFPKSRAVRRRPRGGACTPARARRGPPATQKPENTPRASF